MKYVHWCYSGVFIFNFEYILLTFNFEQVFSSVSIVAFEQANICRASAVKFFAKFYVILG